MVLRVVVFFLVFGLVSPICLANAHGKEGAKLNKTLVAFGLERNHYKEWEGLTPEEREKLRRKMEHYKNMPQEDQKLIRKRYEDWKKLPPETQRELKKTLERWDQLGPEEKKALKEFFR